MSQKEPENGARRHPHVVNVSEVAAREITRGTRFGATVKQLGGPTGSQSVGCNWFEVAPGRAAFPRHFHCAIEEAIFVLEGCGTARIGDDLVAVSAGDYLTFRAGPEHAHQLSNTGDTPLRYLCLSNKAQADVVGYPDSNKLGVLGSPSVDPFDKPWVRAIFRADATVDYYDGERTD